MSKLPPYSETTQAMMKQFFNTLSEKEQRRYAAVEAHKLGHGGIRYMAGLLGCSRTTIYEGLREFGQGRTEEDYEPRQRRRGGGRKAYSERMPGIDEAFLRVVENHTAGDPMDEGVKWTNLSQAEIQRQLGEQHQLVVSETVVRKLLHKHGFRRRQAQKKEA